MVSRDLPISPPENALHFGLADWVSIPPHRVNSHLTNSVDYFVHSHSQAFHRRNHALRRKTQRIGNRTLDIYPNGESRTIRPPGRGGIRGRNIPPHALSWLPFEPCACGFLRGQVIEQFVWGLSEYIAEMISIQYTLQSRAGIWVHHTKLSVNK